MTRKPDTRPDFTRVETYLKEQSPSISDRTRTSAPTSVADVAPLKDYSRRNAFIIAALFLIAGGVIVLLSDRYGPIVEGIAGVIAAFAIAVTIHILRPKPLLRFLLVVIALACLSVTFATVLGIHLYGAL